MAIDFKPYAQTTIPGVILEGKKLAISESTLVFKDVIDDECVIAFHNVISKHIDALKKYIITIELSEDQFFRYRNKPNLFCYDMYGTPELATSLLYINNMVSITEFKKYTIKVFTTNIMEAVKELMSLNERDLIDNRMRYGIE